MEGGLADNAIPREAKAELLLTGADSAADRLKAEQVVEKLNKALKKELAGKDTDVNVEIAFAERGQRTCMGEKDSERITAFLNSIPHGVQAMSHDMEGLVETSLNLGMLSLAEGKLHAGISVRSSIDSAKYALIGKLKSMAELAGVQVEVTGDYPGWAYRADSPLRDKMTAVYESMYHKKPVVQAIHAGLECGLFAGKIENLDCVSIGPDMKNIHTTEEELSVSSTKRVWEFLLKVLEEM
jgi:dipeptidase D